MHHSCIIMISIISEWPHFDNKKKHTQKHNNTRFFCCCNITPNLIKILFVHRLFFLFLLYLRLVPTGKPVTTIAHNTSSSSIYISWKAPPPDTILGEFLGYRITYRIRDKNNDAVKEIYIRDSSVEVSFLKIHICFSQHIIHIL